jgi:Flp pilus assembly protein TadG
MKLKLYTRPLGQSLIIFVFLSLGLLALLALSLDFGFAMYSRRVAQNAADSAALAAARILCLDSSANRYINATIAATDFAETYNHAFIANPPDLTEICMYGDGQACSAGLDKGQARVLVEITHNFCITERFFS